MKIKNPILPGFNPDPSIIRVGTEYYNVNAEDNEYGSGDGNSVGIGIGIVIGF